MDTRETAPPKPGTLRHLVCGKCGATNEDPSWVLIRDQWIHRCPLEEGFEDDPTPVTDKGDLKKWVPKT